MNIKSTVATLGILSALSFGAFAADSISADQAQSRQSLGTVSVGSVASSPMDMRAELNKKRKNKVLLLIALSKHVPVTTGTQQPNCTNKFYR